MYTSIMAAWFYVCSVMSLRHYVEHMAKATKFMTQVNTLAKPAASPVFLNKVS